MLSCEVLYLAVLQALRRWQPFAFIPAEAVTNAGLATSWVGEGPPCAGHYAVLVLDESKLEPGVLDKRLVKTLEKGGATVVLFLSVLETRAGKVKSKVSLGLVGTESFQAWPATQRLWDHYRWASRLLHVADAARSAVPYPCIMLLCCLASPGRRRRRRGPVGRRAGSCWPHRSFPCSPRSTGTCGDVMRSIKLDLTDLALCHSWVGRLALGGTPEDAADDEEEEEEGAQVRAGAVCLVCLC